MFQTTNQLYGGFHGGTAKWRLYCGVNYGGDIMGILAECQVTIILNVVNNGLL